MKRASIGLCPRCKKWHGTLRPALLCLHAWQNDFEKGHNKEKFTPEQYMAMQRYVERLEKLSAAGAQNHG